MSEITSEEDRAGRNPFIGPWNQGNSISNICSVIHDLNKKSPCPHAHVLSHSVVSNSLWHHGLQPARLLCPWGFSRQENWRGLPCPHPGDLFNPGIKPMSPTLQAESLLSEPPGKPKNTGRVVYPFSRGSSQPRNQTRVSSTAGRFFTNGATRETPTGTYCSIIYCCSVTKSCPLWPLWPQGLQCSSLPRPSLSPRIKLMSTESVMPSNHPILCHPLLLLPSIFPSIRVFSNESALDIKWPKYWSFTFSFSPTNEYSGLISFKINWLNLLTV